MARVNVRNDKLYLDFTYQKIRCREMTDLTDTPQNRKRAEAFLERLMREIRLKNFRYERYFPNSKRAIKFRLIEAEHYTSQLQETVDFKTFSQLWLCEKYPEWRKSYQKYIDDIFELYLYPEFGHKAIGTITKSDIMLFRNKLCELEKNQKPLSASRINHIMSPLRSVLLEASERLDFTLPWRNIKPLPVPKSDIKPFSLCEVQKILRTVRADFKCYYTVRFFMGLRTGEIDGLTWDKVDFERKQLIIDRSLGKDGELGPTKTHSSVRVVDMSNAVHEALTQQYKLTYDKSDFVFCTNNGKPLRYKNVTKRVWYPLLELLQLQKRRPYHSRHTTATLWLAAGESPEWIAKQLGHSNTTMLFTVYSRYVPNLTRQDGSAFEALLNQS